MTILLLDAESAIELRHPESENQVVPLSNTVQVDLPDMDSTERFDSPNSRVAFDWSLVRRHSIGCCVHETGGG